MVISRYSMVILCYGYLYIVIVGYKSLYMVIGGYTWLLVVIGVIHVYTWLKIIIGYRCGSNCTSFGIWRELKEEIEISLS